MRLRSRLDRPGRSQTSPYRTVSLRSTSLGTTGRTSLRADVADGGVGMGPPRGAGCAAKRVEFSHTKGGSTMAVAPYRIRAVRYAHRRTTSTEVFYHDMRDTPMTMDYFVWVLENGRHTVVVDLGFTEPVGTRRGRQF